MSKKKYTQNIHTKYQAIAEAAISTIATSRGHKKKTKKEKTTTIFNVDVDVAICTWTSEKNTIE